ncbi:putative methyltransferase-domain-containing protein [Russula aff. rugulosa BPL654]|nr:putative methyltransferase-domain-containing protein [Russula aff. rugulosa BPL654]
MTDTDGGEDDEGLLALGTIFTEPPRPPSPEPTIADNHHHHHDHDDPNLSLWSTISVRLVGSHPLWGHYLWNAARALAGFLQRNSDLYLGRNVLELGAGGGLPGLVTAKCGARKVVLTDYPDKALLDNLAYNVDQNVLPPRRAAVHVVGYVWGSSVDPLLAAAPLQDTEPIAGPDTRNFDLILLSDLIFNHSQHRALLTTCERTIAPGGCVLVFYTHHRPHLAHRDMEFFEIAGEMRWVCEKVLTERFPPMFPEDSGEEEVRSTVHGWKLTRV